MRKTLKQTVDYADFLRTLAADLTGGASLAYELIQNADDAPGVTTLVLDFRDTALHVMNDSSFRDEDFERLQRLAGGGKRTEAGTTGSFGVGFTSVYQVTDHPTIRSAGQQWTMFPEKGGAIEVEEIDDDGRTEFILPWARDAESEVRRLLQQPPVTPQRISQLQEETHAVLPLALLFLRKLKELELRVEGEVIAHAVRRRTGNAVEITIGGEVYRFELLQGDFGRAAKELKLGFPAVIEAKRLDDTWIAVSPSLVRSDGRVFAYLPTEMHAGVPIHLNADFFTRTNRKTIDLESMGKADWNKAALGCMAACLAANLLEVRDVLGPIQFLELLDALHVNAGEVTPDRPVGGFWLAVASVTTNAPVVPDQDGGWRLPGEVCYPAQGEEEYECIDALRMLGLSIVHPAARRFRNLLIDKGVGVRLLNWGLLLERLTTTDRLAEICSHSASHAQLAKLVAVLREVDPKNQSALQTVKGMPLVWTRDATLRAPRDVRQAEESIAVVLSALGLSSQVVDARTPGELVDLCQTLLVGDALGVLESVDPRRWQQVWDTDRGTVLELHRWLVDHESDWRQNHAIAARIRRLPIWPSAGRVGSLDDLVVPGGFEDPLGLAAVLDVEALRDSGSLSTLVNGRELTIQSFAMHHIPRVLGGGIPVANDTRRRVVALLAKYRSHLVNEPGIQAALAGCSLVECAGGEFRPASESYFRNAVIGDVLGPGAPLVSPSVQENAAVRELYEWLGVATTPRDADVVQRARDLAARVPNPDNVAAVARIVGYFGQSWPQGNLLPETLGELRDLVWLPRRGDRHRWWKPADLFATYRAYLFESSGDFVGFDKPLQEEASAVLKWLGVRPEPTVEKVVAHLRNGMRENREVNIQVYDFLDQERNCREPLVQRLGQEACLGVGDGKYVKPQSAFWQEPNLGRYAVRLGAEFRRFSRLLAAWEVRESPGPVDAERVLRDLNQEFGVENRQLTEEANNVAWACWSLLSAQSSSASPNWAWLQQNRVVPNREHMLAEPRNVFIEDRPGLSGRFGELLVPNVIDQTEAAGALLKAGVRLLSEVVTGTIVDVEEDGSADDLRARIEHRQNAIRRILASASPALFSVIAERLSEMDIWYAARLVIAYQLTAFGRPISSEPEEADAFFERDRARLWVLRGDDAPWAPVARELALYLLPDRDPGMVAAALAMAFGASSSEEAGRILDTLGLARTQAAVGPTPSPVAETSDEDLEPWSSREPNPTGRESGSTEQRGDQQVPAGTGTMSEGPRAGARTAERKKAPAARLRSYVTIGDESTDDVGVGQTADLEVGRQGVELVMEYEEGRGWDAREMAHYNPGYDVVSTGPNGEEIYIEVKSLSGPWNEIGVGLSKPQFDFARTYGDAAWLYIVEDVFGTPRLYRIQDPARRVTHYHFDNGWTAAVTNPGGEGLPGAGRASP